MAISQKLLRMEEHWVPSKYLNEKQFLQVALPARYSPLSSYPILFVLDGDHYRRQGRLVTLIEKSFGQGAAEWLTVFLPCPADDRQRLYHPNSNDFGLVSRFLMEEAIPYLEQAYSTWTMGAGRGLLGSSLSATAVLHTAFAYPNSFHVVCAQSPYLPDSLLNTWMEKSKRSQKSLPLHIYLSAGLQESQYPMTTGEIFDFLAAARQFNSLFQTAVMQLTYDELEDGHTWGSWQSGLAAVLPFLDSQWSSLGFE